jgi:predicted RNase H-like HicB family nuclease
MTTAIGHRRGARGIGPQVTDKRLVLRRHYIGLVQVGATAYALSFPDFPGLVIAAGTLEEAIERAGEELVPHVARMLEEHEPVPSPSSFQEFKKVAPDHQNTMLVLIPLEVMGSEPA